MPMLWQSLFYHWKMNLVIIMGIMIATAVLAGAFLVGDSVHESLRDLTLDRLGHSDIGLVSGRWFREDLGGELVISSHSHGFTHFAPIILVRGSVATLNTSGQETDVAGDVSIIGVDERFWKLFEESSRSDWSRSAIINRPLAEHLHAETGDRLLLRLEKPTNAPRETLLGQRDDIITQIPLNVSEVLEPSGVGRFGLQASQQLPYNLFLPLQQLQESLQRAQRVNVILVQDTQFEHEQQTTYSQHRAELLNNYLNECWQLEDLGLRIVPYPDRDYFSLESEFSLIEPTLSEAVIHVTETLKLPRAPTLTYLANRISTRKRSIPYSTVSALPASTESFLSTSAPSLGPLPLTTVLSPNRLRNQEDLPSDLGIMEGDLLLNQWAFDDLQAEVGSPITLEYFEVDAQGNLEETTKQFILRGVVEMKGLGIDPGLTPEFPGITDAKTLFDWDPPFPFDFSRVRRTPPNDQDERYWKEYRATPKAFVSLKTGQRLWSSRFGNVSSIRVGRDPDKSLTATIDSFKQTLLSQLSPGQLGMTFRPIKQDGIKAISGSTNFSNLFLGFSFFLICSACLLIGLLFRLGTERRSPEIGILLATGFTANKVLQYLFLEGLVIIGFGALIGLLAAIGYASLILAGLRSPQWWLPAVGSPFVHLHIKAPTLITGYATSVLVALFTITWVIYQFNKMPVLSLLTRRFANETYSHSINKSHRLRLSLFLLSSLAAITLLFLGMFKLAPAQLAFFGGGALLLTAGITGLHYQHGRLRETLITGEGSRSIVRLAARNGRRHPGRSLLVIGLISSATFLVVAISTFHRDPRQEQPSKHSGNGGFLLVAKATVPLVSEKHLDSSSTISWLIHSHNNTPSETAASPLNHFQSFAFRYRPSDDASCLNLFVPQQPSLLGATPSFIKRGGFRFTETLAVTEAEKDNPWLLLDQTEQEDNTISVMGDMNTLMWTYHKGIGETIDVMNDHGEIIHLKIKGILQDSLFQSTLILSENQFLEHFSSSGYGYFLIEDTQQTALTESFSTNNPRTRSLSQHIETQTIDHGLDVKTTADQLREYLTVQNTYLSTFQALGGLGLILGVLGSGIAILRNVLDRTGELALMRALGFSQPTLGWMVMMENTFILILGLAIGTVAALSAIVPHAILTGSDVHWTSLAITLGLVLISGVFSGLTGLFVALKTPLLPALRAE